MRLLWRPGALDDRMAIFDYIAHENSDVALEVDDRVRVQTDLLRDHPHIGRPGRIDDTRELVVAGTPYVIAYRLTADTIT